LLRECAQDLHQVQGTLRMVELYGAAMVVENMERIADALVADTVRQREEAYSVLMRGMVQLPDYLERLQSGAKDIPIVLLPLLNDLRAVLGENLLSESALFTPILPPTCRNLRRARQRRCRRPSCARKPCACAWLSRPRCSSGSAPRRRRTPQPHRRRARPPARAVARRRRASPVVDGRGRRRMRRRGRPRTRRFGQAAARPRRPRDPPFRRRRRNRFRRQAAA
jgi:hypothetical protein